MTPKSVKKKLKQPSFAAAVSREDLQRGASDLGVDFDEHLSVVIAALAERQDDLLPERNGDSPERSAASPERSAASPERGAASPERSAASPERSAAS
jgi:hypothetical protein